MKQILLFVNQIWTAHTYLFSVDSYPLIYFEIVRLKNVGEINILLNK